ncbi:reverse transcriptase domain-containing protein [Enterobacter ludwigii]|uniref:reverse transcriptase domain-containing protein n=1 Tax=Enterobacter ludwigii TaxID=299767 RepID=UPI002FD2338C
MSIPDIRQQQTTLCRVQAGEALDAAWQWLCDARKGAPDNADIWHLRHHWHRTRDDLLTRLLNGTYRLTPMLLTKKRPHHDRQVMWGAQDALVLKWTALLITPDLDLHPRCEHVKGHGGGPQSVRRMHDALTTQKYTRVCRTDVKGYYRHINKDRLMHQVKQHITDPVLQGLIHQYLHYTVEDGGEFHTPESGIARGCALSPLMGALHLHAMDTWFAGQMERAKKNNKPGIYYARYMDDIVILAHTRWQLRRQVRALNQFFNEGGFCQHPDKTFIGRTERGFDWMGAQMSDTGVEGIAHRARTNHLERLRRLYERVRKWPAARRQARMSQYRKRWKIWAGAILLALSSNASRASIGNSSDLDSGFRKCVSAGSLGALPNNKWGGTCSITLPSRGFTPQSTTPGVMALAHGGGTSAGILISSNLTPGDKITLTLSSQYTFTTDAAKGNPTQGTGGLDAGLEFTAVPVGSGVRTIGTIQYPAGMACDYLKAYTSAAGPNDEMSPGYPSSPQPCKHTIPGGTLKWTLTRNLGDTIKYPTLNLNVLGSSGPSNVMIGIGVGGNGGVNPNPVDPPVAGDPPNCTAWAGNVATATPVDLGNAIPSASTGVKLSTSLAPTTTVGMTCQAGANGAIAAKPYLLVANKNSTVNADLYTLVKAGDWLGLRLKLPSSPQGNGQVATGQTAGGYVKWNGTSATRIWDWSLAADVTANANIPVSQMTLTPEIWQVAARNTTDGTRSFQVEYSVVMP